MYIHPWGILQIALQFTVPTLQVKSLSFWSLSMIEVQYSGGDLRQLELSFESMVCSWIQVHPSLQCFVARVWINTPTFREKQIVSDNPRTHLYQHFSIPNRNIVAFKCLNDYEISSKCARKLLTSHLKIHDMGVEGARRGWVTEFFFSVDG